MVKFPDLEHHNTIHYAFLLLSGCQEVSGEPCV